MKPKFQVLILAAGKGTRMKSSKAKVLHEVFYAPMIHHVLNAVNPLDADQQIVVVGHQQDTVKESLAGYDVVYAEQKEQLGTGHAVLSAEELLMVTSGVVMILCGDTPLVRTETLQEMLELHFGSKSQVTVMTTTLDNPRNYGRIISDENGYVLQIVEEKDASSAQRSISEVNAGIYCVDVDFLCRTLKKVGTDNQQGEVYLTDIVEVATGDGLHVSKFVCQDSDEILGVNSRIELAQAHAALQDRYHRFLMMSGVTLYQPSTIVIENTVSIALDTIIYPNVSISGSTIIGHNCLIESFTDIKDCHIGNHVTIGTGSHVHGCEFADNESIGPCFKNF